MGTVAGGTGEGCCSAPGAGYLVGPVLPGRRGLASMRDDPGSDAASPFARSALGVGDRREPGAASERAGGWNQQPGLSH